MPRDQLFEKTVSYTTDIVGPLIGKEKRNIKRIQENHPNVRITHGRDGKYPCFMVSSVSLDAVNNCVKDLQKQIIRANIVLEQSQEKKRIEKERTKAKAKAEAERRMREKITKELEERKKNNVKQNIISETEVISNNVFGALLLEDEE